MTAEPDNSLTFVRVLEAPRERVWRACRDREVLERWWGLPRDAAMPCCTVDFRVGGALHFQAVLADGAGIWIKCLYREIVDGERLVLEQHYSDAAGNVLDTPDRPASTITLRFEDLGGKTRLTVTHVGMASPAVPIALFRQGWSESLDRLADSLTRR